MTQTTRDVRAGEEDPADLSVYDQTEAFGGAPEVLVRASAGDGFHEFRFRELDDGTLRPGRESWSLHGDLGRSVNGRDAETIPESVKQALDREGWTIEEDR